MIRFLQILALIFVVWLAIRFVKRLLQKSKSRPRGRSIPKAVDMLPCAYCGEYVPEPDAVMKNGKAYCSQKHCQADR